MMAARLTVHAWRVTAVSGNRLKNGRAGRDAECRGEHQNQRRNDPEGQK
jgi:hypothetical protein